MRAPTASSGCATIDLVIAAERSRSLVVVNLATGKFTAASKGQAGSHMLAVSRDRRRAYVSNIMAGSVSVFDLRRMVKLSDIPTDGYPEGIALSPDGHELWVGDASAGKLRAIDLPSGRLIDALDLP